MVKKTFKETRVVMQGYEVIDGQVKLDDEEEVYTVHARRTKEWVQKHMSKEGYLIKSIEYPVTTYVMTDEDFIAAVRVLKEEGEGV